MNSLLETVRAKKYTILFAVFVILGGSFLGYRMYVKSHWWKAPNVPSKTETEREAKFAAVRRSAVETTIIDVTKCAISPEVVSVRYTDTLTFKNDDKNSVFLDPVPYTIPPGGTTIVAQALLESREDFPPHADKEQLFIYVCGTSNDPTAQNKAFGRGIIFAR